MVTLLHTTNPVRLSFVQALLLDAGVHVEVFDANISALEAGIGAFPRRLMVDRTRWRAAKTILIDAGEFYND